MKAIVAVDRNWMIGSGKGDLPWCCSPDLKRFREITTGQVLVFGFNTFNGMSSFSLPGREIIEIHEQRSIPREIGDYSFKGTVSSLEYDTGDLTSLASRITKISGDRSVFVAGGAKIYSLLLPFIQEFYVTVIDHENIVRDPVYLARDFIDTIKGNLSSKPEMIAHDQANGTIANFYHFWK